MTHGTENDASVSYLPEPNPLRTARTRPAANPRCEPDGRLVAMASACAAHDRSAGRRARVRVPSGAPQTGQSDRGLLMRSTSVTPLVEQVESLARIAWVVSTELDVVCPCFTPLPFSVELNTYGASLTCQVPRTYHAGSGVVRADKAGEAFTRQRVP